MKRLNVSLRSKSHIIQPLKFLRPKSNIHFVCSLALKKIDLSTNRVHVLTYIYNAQGQTTFTFPVWPHNRTFFAPALSPVGTVYLGSPANELKTYTSNYIGPASTGRERMKHTCEIHPLKFQEQLALLSPPEPAKNPPTCSRNSKYCIYKPLYSAECVDALTHMIQLFIGLLPLRFSKINDIRGLHSSRRSARTHPKPRLVDCPGG